MRKTFKVSSLTKIKTLFILVVYQPWGVMKKFVNWCHTIDTIYALLSNFIKNKKKQTSKCRENWIPLRRWLILLISTNTKTHACGIVICRSRCRVPLFSQRHSVFFKCYFIFWQDTQESITNLIGLDYETIQFEESLIQIHVVI